MASSRRKRRQRYADGEVFSRTERRRRHWSALATAVGRSAGTTAEKFRGKQRRMTRRGTTGTESRRPVEKTLDRRGGLAEGRSTEYIPADTSFHRPGDTRRDDDDCGRDEAPFGNEATTSLKDLWKYCHRLPSRQTVVQTETRSDWPS